MGYEYNGKEISQEELLKKIDDPNTTIESLTVEMNNENYTGEVTMEGFDIPRDVILELAKACDDFGGEAKATFENCGKLGGKTLILIVK